MVDRVREYSEGRELLAIVQISNRLHMVHQEAIIQQHSILVVNTFTARNLDGRRPALHSG